MKTNGNDPSNGYGFCTADGGSVAEYTGLTKREYFAVMAMQGMWAGITDQYYDSYDVIASMAVKQADALINELNKTQS